MNEGDELFLSRETRKRRKRSGFRYSSKKALDCSRLTRRIAKAGGLDFTSITKELLYPSALSIELSIFYHHDCITGFGSPPLLESIDKTEGVRIENHFANLVSKYP
jgi:hypothetical protein